MKSLKYPFAAIAAGAAPVVAAALLAMGAAPAALAAPTTVSPAPGIRHILVIELENESESVSFGPSSPAVYLNQTLLPQGELLPNYFATGHVSLDNYVAQVSGQESTISTNDDCIATESLTNPPLVGLYLSVTPGNDDANPTAYPGQVDGDGCVYPGPTATTHGAQTIGDQLDAQFGSLHPLKVLWREYAEDMGNDLARDYGAPDQFGVGADCSHPAIGALDKTNTGEAGDQYADRHNPFIYFHSVIDNAARCNKHVVPLGVALVNGPDGDTFIGHLHYDLAKADETPSFMFVTPNLCDDGHDNPCHGTNIEGGTTGGLVGADLWLKHYMPMIMASPAYQNGSLLVIVTFDEGGDSDVRACPNADQSTCGSPVGPNVSNPGYSSILGLYGLQTPPTANYQYAGGGQVGMALFNKRYIKPGTVNTNAYNHYSALRSYEDLLGINTGGDDGLGHLGYASGPNVVPFGADVFNNRK
jgi:hypothetical protein